MIWWEKIGLALMWVGVVSHVVRDTIKEMRKRS